MQFAVTVVIPTYNRRDMLRAAVASCFRSAVGINLEVIVVDDHSSEAIAEALNGFEITLIRHTANRGSSAARNTGKAAASGQYIKFLDSDDMLVDGALAQEYALAAATDADILVSDWIQCQVGSSPEICEHEVRHTSPNFGGIIDDVLAGKGVPTSSALYRGSLAASLAWDASMSTLNDWDYFVSAALASERISRYDGPSYYWRKHAGDRITGDSSLLNNAKSFYRILGRLETELRRRKELTPSRQHRLAQYLYKELRGAYRFDAVLGQRELKHIVSLDPSFRPIDEERSRFFRFVGSVLPIGVWVPIYAAIRRCLS